MVNSSDSKITVLDTVPKLTSEVPGVPFIFVEDIKHPYLLHFKGDSMFPVILPDDWLILDADSTAETNDIVAAYQDGKLIVGTLVLCNEQTFLRFENPQLDFVNINYTDVLGVVKSRHRYF